MSTDERPWKLVTIADTERMTWLRIILDDGHHGRMESTDLVEVRQESGRPDHMMVFGDLCPGLRGVVSDLGYGLSWFARSSGSPHYLASKFLADDFHPELAAEGLRANAAQIKREAEEYPDDADPEVVADQIERLNDLAASVEAEEEGKHAVWELWSDIYGDTEGCPGWGPNPRDFRLLVAIACRLKALGWTTERAA